MYAVSVTAIPPNVELCISGWHVTGAYSSAAWSGAGCRACGDIASVASLQSLPRVRLYWWYSVGARRRDLWGVNGVV